MKKKLQELLLFKLQQNMLLKFLIELFANHLKCLRFVKKWLKLEIQIQ